MGYAPVWIKTGEATQVAPRDVLNGSGAQQGFGESFR